MTLPGAPCRTIVESPENTTRLSSVEEVEKPSVSAANFERRASASSSVVGGEKYSARLRQRSRYGCGILRPFVA